MARKKKRKPKTKRTPSVFAANVAHYKKAKKRKKK
jgi:hypothetical protein